MVFISRNRSSSGRSASHCWWEYHGSWCADTLCIVSLCVWFENRKDDEHSTLFYWKIHRLQVRTGLWLCGSSPPLPKKLFLCERRSWRNVIRITRTPMNRSDRPKIVDSEAVIQAIQANLASSSWRISGEFCISLSNVVCYLHDLDKNIHSCQIVLTVTKILQNFRLTFIKESEKI